MPRSALIPSSVAATLPRVHCPTCGAPVPAHRITVDYERLTVHFAGKTVHTRRASLIILKELMKRYPRAVTQDKLKIVLWGGRAKRRSIATLRVNMMHLRNALADLKILIPSFPDRRTTRYRLVLPDADTVRAMVEQSKADVSAYKQIKAEEERRAARPRGRPKTKTKSIAETLHEQEAEAQKRLAFELVTDKFYEAEANFIDAIKEDDK